MFLYDRAVFYTSEYEQKFNVKKDIQRLVETPELLYLIGRCANNDEQLGYIETRVSCLRA